MSDDPHTTDSISYLQKYIAVVGGLLAPILVVYLLITSNAYEAPAPVKTDVAKNIKPLAQVEVAPDRTNYVDMSGEEVFNQACAACHTAGMMNAPKVGDQAGWKARIAQGYKALVNNAINGVRAMPARGGNPDLTDLEVARGVTYMANQSGASFAAPVASIPESQ
jgi:cytochrome c5